MPGLFPLSGLCTRCSTLCQECCPLESHSANILHSFQLCSELTDSVRSSWPPKTHTSSSFLDCFSLPFFPQHVTPFNLQYHLVAYHIIYCLSVSLEYQFRKMGMLSLLLTDISLLPLVHVVHDVLEDVHSAPRAVPSTQEFNKYLLNEWKYYRTKSSKYSSVAG